MLFKDSQTHFNLMRAFAGESQARNRYTFAYDKALKMQLYGIAEVFKMTAQQEKAHAEIFYNHLKSLTGQNIKVDGSYPVEVYDDMVGLLKAAHHDEFEEFENIYPAFAKAAEAEGFLDVAYSFNEIAKVEKVHGLRFAALAKALEDHSLYQNNQESMWMCLNCGHIYTGIQVPPKCPVCQHPQGYFVALTKAPFTDMSDLEMNV